MISAHALRELEEDALLGELARPLTHEFNNFLNTLLLQFAIIEQHAEEAMRDSTSAIRKEAKSIAGHIREWQRYKKARAEGPESIDLNAIIREILVDGEHGSATIELSLSASPAAVSASIVDVKRLCGIIIRNALDAVGRQSSGTIGIQTSVGADDVTLVVQDNREGMATQDVATWFDIRPESRSTRALEMAACQAMARRLHGAIEAEKGPADELLIRLRLPANRV